MNVGIYTHYAQCDQTYLTVRLAEYLRSCGVDFSIYADNQPAKLKIPYDNLVVHRSRQKYSEWLKGRSAVVWTHIPKIEQINIAKRRGILTVLAPMWQELSPPFRKAARQADHVIALCTENRELFHGVYKFRNTTLIPFDAGLPPTKKDAAVNARKIKLFLPWYDRNARCAQSYFLDRLAYLLTHMPEAHLTVCISSSKFSPAIAKFFQRLGQKTDGRVVVARNVPIQKRPSLYAAHDLTINPAECDNYGLCNLTSICCGTPVLTFAVAPQTDFVYPEVNGVLVKTKVDYDENGAPHANPDYDSFADALQTLIAEPRHIDLMNKKINYNLNSRRKAFELGWQSVLRLV
jgi:glycosyltransferase involved in cell wall biosynthesis